MTALFPTEQLSCCTIPVRRPARGEKPDAYLMLMLRCLPDEELADLEQNMQVYERTGVVCGPLSRFID